jgi:hypothetical protein
MKKLLTTIWNKFLSILNSKKQQQLESKEFAKVFAKKIKNEYVVLDSTNNEILKETIHPTTPRKERFSSSHEYPVVVENNIFSLTEKQFMFYTVIKELTEEFGKAKAKDICIRYIGELNFHSENLDTPEWMFKLSAHNKTMKFLLKSGLVIKLNKGYKTIK